MHQNGLYQLNPLKIDHHSMSLCPPPPARWAGGVVEVVGGFPSAAGVLAGGHPSTPVCARLCLGDISYSFSPMAFKFSDMLTMDKTLN